MADAAISLYGKGMEAVMYWRIGQALANVSTTIIFFALWIFCAFHYGFLYGLGFGWVPAIIMAFVLWFIIAAGWGLIAGPLMAIFFTWLFYSDSGHSLLGVLLLFGAFMSSGFVVEWLIHRYPPT